MTPRLKPLTGFVVYFAIPLVALGACLTADDLTQAVKRVASASGGTTLGDTEFVRQVFKSLFNIDAPASLAGDAQHVYSQLTAATGDWEPANFPTKSAADRQSTLQRVQEVANLGELVIVARNVDDHNQGAHIALVVPAGGTPLVPDANWSNAPNIAQGTGPGVSQTSASDVFSKGFKPAEASRIEFFRYKH
jgi:hypothetical protein